MHIAHCVGRSSKLHKSYIYWWDEFAVHEQQLINAIAHTMKPKVQNKTAKSAYRLCSTDWVFFSPSFLSFVYIFYIHWATILKLNGIAYSTIVVYSQYLYRTNVYYWMHAPMNSFTKQLTKKKPNTLNIIQQYLCLKR